MNGSHTRQDTVPEIDRAELLAAAPEARHAALLGFLHDAYLHCSRDRGAAVGAGAAAEPHPGTPLFLESLEMTTLKVLLEAGLDVSLPFPRLAEAGTLGRLTALVDEALLAQEQVSPAPPPAVRADVPGRHAPFGLTDVQHAYWLGRSGLFELGEVSAHLYLEFESEDFDAERASRVLQRLVRRHDMLRAVIRSDGRQQVLSDVPDASVGFEDLSAAEPGHAAGRLAAVREELSHEVRDADRWPLFEVRAQRLPSGTTHVHLSLDLLIADAGSVRLLLEEWAVLYADPEAELEPLEVAFRDYVQALTAADDADAHAGAREYWQQRAQVLPPAPQLPVRSGLEKRARFTRRSFVLGTDRWNRLRRRAAAVGATPTAVMLTAYAEVLALWSRSPHFTVNLTVADRPPVHPGIDQVLGDFTSLVLIDLDPTAEPDFTARVGAAQRLLWEGLEHRAFSGVRVLREIARLHGPARAVMPVVFTSLLGQDFSALDGTVPGLGRVVGGISQTPQVHLDHQVYEHAGGVTVNWDALEAAFPPELLDDAFGTYRRLLERLSDDPGAWGQQHPVALPDHQLSVREQVNRTTAPLPDGLLHEAVARAAGQAPDRVAVISSGRTLTYGEVMRRARRIGRVLRARGVVPGALVGVSMEKGWQQVVAVLGVLESGGAYVPLDPHLPPSRTAWLLERTGAEVVLTDRRPADAVWPGGVRVMAVDDDELSGDQSEAPLEAVAGPDDLAYVIFTSGSTGQPKGVMVTHRAAANTIADISRRFGVGADDRVLALSSLSFDLSVYDVFGTLAAGGTIVLPEPGAERDPAQWAELVRDHRVTVWNSVPALFELFVEHLVQERGQAPEGDSGDRTADGLRLVMMSGDWIPVTLPGRARPVVPKARLISLGGATEAAIWSIFHPIDEVDDSWTSIPYGRPLANQRFHVLDGMQRHRPTWVPGELFIAGAGLAQGYWRDAERTAAGFVTHQATGERLYRTGDMGRYLPDGSIEFLGREDFQVKIGGFRIELGEIEAALSAHPGVSLAVVSALGEDRGHRRLVAYVVATSGTGVEADELRGHLRATLPEYMVPAAILVLGSLPLTANGKVDRAALPDPAADVRPREQTPPRTPVEWALAAVWKELLGHDTISVHDDLFALGADSLLAVRATTAIDARGLHLPLGEIFGHPTIAGQATVATAVGVSALPAIHPDPAGRALPFGLTDVQHAYWLGRSGVYDLGDVAAHLYLEFESHDFDPERAAGVLRQLVDRHDMLRAVVRADGRQQVLSAVPDPVVGYEDLSGLDPLAAMVRVDAVREELSHQIRAADQWPLFELRAQRLPSGPARLHLSMDLLIADAASVRILLEEFGARYAASGTPGEPPGLSFRDYVLALGAAEHTEAYAAARDYWLRRVPGLPPAPRLPVTTGAAQDTGRFVRRSFELGAAPWARLKERAAAAGVTPSAVLLAAYAQVLSVWASSPEFTVNVTVADRLAVHPDVDRVIGDFTSLILVDVDTAAAPDFTALAQAAQRRLWQGLEHRAFSGVRVLRELARRHGPARATMPVVFTSLLGQDFAALSGSLPGLGRLVGGITQTPQVYLDHQVYEHPGGLVTNWDSLDAVFPPGVLEYAFAAYRSLLDRLCDHPDTWRQTHPVPLPHQHLATRTDGAADGTAEEPREHEEPPAAAPAVPAHTPPRTPAERAVAEVWAELLTLDRLGVDDDVFALGADSLLAVRAAAALDGRGLHVSLRDLLENGTIAAQAARVSPVSGEAQQALITGPSRLTPTQLWLLEQDLPQRQHWNDASFLLSLQRPLDVDVVRAALRTVLTHHDGLRMRFAQTEGWWTAWIDGMPDELPFSSHDLSGLDGRSQKAEVTRISDALQRTLDLQSGPVLRVAYFDLGPRPHCLLFLAHWLVVDHFSARVTLEDLLDGYVQLERTGSATLPPKTTDFPTWTESTRRRAQSTAVLDELDYWTRPERRLADRVKCDHPDGRNGLDSAVDVTIRLDHDLTAALLRDVPGALGGDIVDILSTALLRALPLQDRADDRGRSPATRRLLLDLQRHGRDQELDGATAARTVGRFSTLAPVLLETVPDSPPSEALARTARQLRAVPGSGAGYGMLRYLCRDPRAEALREAPYGDVGLNYVGQIDEVFLRHELLSVPRTSFGEHHSRVGTRSRVLDVLCFVVAGQLTITVTYSENLHERPTVDRILDRFTAELEALVQAAREQSRPHAPRAAEEAKEVKEGV